MIPVQRINHAVLYVRDADKTYEASARLGIQLAQRPGI